MRSDMGISCGPANANMTAKPQTRGEIEPLLDRLGANIKSLSSVFNDLEMSFSPVLSPDSPLEVSAPMPSNSIVGGILADFIHQIECLEAKIIQVKIRSQV